MYTCILCDNDRFCSTGPDGVVLRGQGLGDAGHSDREGQQSLRSYTVR